MFYRFQEFVYPTEAGQVEIQIDPKRGYARVFAPPGVESDTFLRTLLEEKSWRIHTCAVSATRSAMNVYLLRGDALLNFLKLPGTHNDTALHLLEKEWAPRVKAQRVHEAELREALLKEAGMPGKKEAAGVLVYCTRTRRYLVQKRAANISAGGKWCQFGGGLERYESPSRAAQREFQEETGLIFSEEKLVPLWVFEDDQTVFFNFLLVLDREIECQIDPAETETYRWVTLEQMNQLDLLPGVVELFRHDKILQEIAQLPEKGSSFSEIVDGILGKTPPDDDSPLVA